MWEIAIVGKILERYEILRNPVPDQAMAGAVEQGKGEVFDAKDRYDKEKAKLDGSD